MWLLEAAYLYNIQIRALFQPFFKLLIVLLYLSISLYACLFIVVQWCRFNDVDV